MELIYLILTLAWIVWGTARLRWHPFLVLFLAAVGLALALGTSTDQVLPLINAGFGGTLGKIGLIILFGALLGEVLERNGATTLIAHAVVSAFKRLPATYTMSLIGYIVAIPVFCDAAFVILSPLAKGVARNAKASGKAVVVALSTGLFAPHVLVPPTPGPLAAAAALGLDRLGLLVLAGAVLALVLVLVGARFAQVLNASIVEKSDRELGLELPSTKGPVHKALMPLLLPLVLIAGGNFFTGGAGHFAKTMDTMSQPEVALALAVLLAVVLPARDRVDLSAAVKKSLENGGPVLLITAMGGALGAVLKLINVASYLEHLAIPPALVLGLPFVVAAVLKSAQGSSTVAIITTATMMLPMLEGLGLNSDVGKVWTILALGTGAMTVSHANDSYFWIVKEMGGLTADEAFRYHTRATALQGMAGLFLVVVSGWLVL